MAIEFISGGDTRHELLAFADARYAEAQALRKAQLSEGAAYLAGIAVELLLKAAICKGMNEPELLKPFRIHDLEQLRTLAGLRGAMATDPDIQRRFTVVNTFLVFDRRYKRKEHQRDRDPRYRSGTPSSDLEAVFAALDDNSGGLWPWLKARA